MKDDDQSNIPNDPHADGHLPVSGEFSSNNPHANDSDLLNQDSDEL